MCASDDEGSRYGHPCPACHVVCCFGVAATLGGSDPNDSRSSPGLQNFRVASVEASKRRLQIAERSNRAQIQTQPDDCLRDLRPDADENRLTAQQACGLDHFQEAL